MSYRRLLGSMLAFLLAFQWAGVYAATEQVTYVHSDHLGSPILGRDDTGATVFEYDYKPYGARDVSQGDAGFVGYTGHAQSDDSGLLYARARWMDPETGRFLSPDSVKYENGKEEHFNRYVYANNQPYRYIDAYGNDSTSTNVEINFPGAVSLAAEYLFRNGIIDVPPQGVEFGISSSFSGVTEASSGLGISGGFIVGAEYGTEVMKPKSVSDAVKGLFKGGFVVTVEYNAESQSLNEVINGQGPMEAGAHIIGGGAGVIHSSRDGLSGAYVSVGPGWNIGAVTTLKRGVAIYGGD